jgi:hypothetical protein
MNLTHAHRHTASIDPVLHLEPHVAPSRTVLVPTREHNTTLDWKLYRTGSHTDEELGSLMQDRCEKN